MLNQITKRKKKIMPFFICLFVCLLFPLFSLISRTGAEEGNPGKVILNIQGMTCASCPATIKKALKKLSGITKAEVSYKESKAVISYEKEKVSAEQMIKAIEGAGYKASVINGERRE